MISIHDNEESSGSHNDEEVNKENGQIYDDDYEVALGNVRQVQNGRTYGGPKEGESG